MDSALFILVAICCAVLFFRAAYHERMHPWAWSISSLGVTGAISLLAGGIGVILVGQAALFVVMWWYNMRRQGRNRG